MITAMFQTICNFFKKEATVAIDCENLSHRMLGSLLDIVYQLKYKKINFVCFINPNRQETSSWVNAAHSAFEKSESVNLTMVYHACKSSKKSSQDVSLAVWVMDQYTRGKLGDFILVSGDKDFEPLVHHVGETRRTYVIDPTCLFAPDPQDKVILIEDANKPLIELVENLLSNTKKGRISLAVIGNEALNRDISYLGKLKSVLKRSKRFTISDNDMVSFIEPRTT